MKNTFENAIIGNTGYIGSFLSKKIKFKFKYNSKNIHRLTKKTLGTVYISAPHALKYWANQNPTEDSKIVDKLISNLKNLTCKRIIYFSSTDIYLKKQNVNENYKVLRKNLNIYGYNRLRIENFIRDNFDDYLIVRLPALFGWKLKKNFFFDILNFKSLKYYNKKTSFQWYFIEWIVKDLKYALKNKIKTINLVSEPLNLLDIVNYLKHDKKNFSENRKIVKYNILTKYSWNKKINRYNYTKSDILKKMKTLYVKKLNKS